MRILRTIAPSFGWLFWYAQSADEAAMEGVIVTAKKAGATIATSVVTNASGEFQFPAARLEPGSYTLRIRAAGYDLAGTGTATIESGRTAVSDLTLTKAGNVTTPLNNTQWPATLFR